VVHEFLEGDGAGRGNICADTQFFNTPIQDSSRNKDAEKYKKDASLLEEALSTETDDFLISRYTFYAAQTNRDAGNPGKALDFYLKRAEMGFWDEERYMSYFGAGKLMEELKYPEESIINTFLKAQEVNPNRAEALHYLTKYCRTHDRNQLGYIMAKEGIQKTFNSDFLFTEMWVYDYGMQDEFSIVSYWAGHYREALESCQELLKNKLVPRRQIERIEKNLNFAKEKLP
jgi:hypothetical protein